MGARGEHIVMVTAYDYPSGRSTWPRSSSWATAAMTVLGHSTTVPATMEEMLMLTRAVTRGERALVVADMPFGSPDQVSDEDAVRNAVRFVKEAAADAVKLEGAGPSLRVAALVGAGIPVMGHLGLTPQSATMLGGFRAQGKTAEKARELLEDALALERAGCFAVVLEAVPAPVAERISDELGAPTIGIGSGAACDGQVLVLHDLLGLYDGPRRASRSATPRSARTSSGRSSASRPRCARASSRRGAHVRDARGGAGSQLAEAASTNGNVRTKIASTARATATAPEQAPALDDRDPVDQQPERPEHEGALDQVEEERAEAVVVLARAERVRSVDEQLTGQTRKSPTTVGTAAKARMCRARR